MLSMWMEKYPLLDWTDFVPQNLLAHVEGPLPHETSYSDDFNRSDEALTDGNWSELANTSAPGWDVVSNEVQYQYSSPDGKQDSVARYDSDLSGDDHKTTIDFTAFGGSSNNSLGPATRCISTATLTCYHAAWRQNSFETRMWKWVAGTATSIANGSETWPGFDVTTTLESDGSSHEFTSGVTSLLSATDTAITGNVRGGIGNGVGWNSFNGTPTGDNFATEDLGENSSSSSNSSSESSSGSSGSSESSSSSSESSSSSQSASSQSGVVIASGGYNRIGKVIQHVRTSIPASSIGIFNVQPGSREMLLKIESGTDCFYSAVGGNSLSDMFPVETGDVIRAHGGEFNTKHRIGNEGVSAAIVTVMWLE